MATSSLYSTAPLSELEKTSIKALLAFTAYDKQVSEATVRDAVLKHFAIDDVEKLPRNSFNEAIRFLVDIQTDLLAMQ